MTARVDKHEQRRLGVATFIEGARKTRLRLKHSGKNIFFKTWVEADTLTFIAPLI